MRLLKFLPSIDSPLNVERTAAQQSSLENGIGTRYTPQIMSVRYRLFLVVSGIFVLVAVCGAFLEDYVMHREIAKAQTVLRQKILDLGEKRRVDFQTYLAATIAENAVKTDAILANISSFSPQAMRFAPTTTNHKRGTWGDAAELLLEYKWIDFLQNTNEGRVTAEIMPGTSLLGPTYRIDIDKDLAWIYLGDLSVHPEPYLGIRVPYSVSPHSVQAVNQGELLEQSYSAMPSAFLLFEPSNMVSTGTAPIFQKNGNSWPSIPVNWAEGYVLEIDPFVKAFGRAQELLQAHKLQLPSYNSQEILQRMDGMAEKQGGLLNAIPSQPLISSISSEKLMKQKLEQLSLQYTQTSMIWGMIAIFETGVFGDQLFAFPSPNGAALFSLDNSVGFGFQTKEVLYPIPLFDDKKYYCDHPSSSPNSNLGSSIAVIASSHAEHVFLGNTAQFIVKAPSGERSGFLTIASNADEILRQIVMALHQTAVLYMDGPLLAYDGNGEREKAQLPLPFSEMAAKKSGIVPWNGENYFFLNLQPFPNIALHVFLLNPEKKEFAFLHDLEAGSQKVVSSILLNIHIAGLIALALAIVLVHQVSRKITRPIIQLAKATKDVAEGRLDQIKLTLPPLKHNDEIAVLCHSFEEMVKGLLEKEKVQGVLNKVVSREIAQEILKGSVHLGGEEKPVTVFFADIREFTNLTQSMQPKEIIELLNTCMTKISQIVDKNGGVIDKYVGDEAMALFGAPISHDDAAIKAVRSAIEIVEELKQWNKERALQGQPSIELGIGIHTGTMLAGNMGAENRLNYTVIGSNVNLASRLCKAAKRNEILISKQTLEEPFVKDAIECEEIPLHTFKGFDQPIEVFSVKGFK